MREALRFSFEGRARRLKRRSESNKLHKFLPNQEVFARAPLQKDEAEQQQRRGEWKQFEFQMHDINNKIDNEKKEGAEFRSISLSDFNSSKSHYSPDFYYYCHLEGLLREQWATQSALKHFLIQFLSSSFSRPLSSVSCQVAAIKTSDSWEKVSLISLLKQWRSHLAISSYEQRRFILL